MVLLTIAQCVLVSLLIFVVRKKMRQFAKSELDIIPGPRSDSFWSGVLPRVFDGDGWDYHRYLWRTFGPVIRFRGMVGENMLYIYDPKALNHIMVKDQETFLPTPPVVAGSVLFFGPGLLSTEGDHHKKQRKLLNPIFSTSHMRLMMPIVYNIMDTVQTTITNQVQDGPKEIDMLAWMGRTALELIGQSGFSHSFDTLTENHVETLVGSALNRIMPLTLEMVFLRVYALHHIVKIGSGAFRKKIIGLLPWSSMKEGRDVADTLHNTSIEIYHAKRKAILEGTTDDKDFLSILIKASMDSSKPIQDRPREEEICGQIATFLFAGTETTSNGTACALWLMSQHKDVQKKLRAEIREAIENAGGEIPHDDLVALPYLDAVCRETMRMYSPVWQVMRKPIKDAIVPLSQPIKGVDGRQLNEIFVPKGTTILCGLLASNNNTELWGPDVFEWKPERWIDGIPDAVSTAELPGIYSNLMSFSAGGRACIGFKFSQLEMKTVLAVLVSKFEFSLSSQEITWCMTNIGRPIVAHGDPMNPQLPLVVSLAA